MNKDEDEAPTEVAAPPQSPSGGRSLLQAVVTALILLGLIILCYALGPNAFFILASVVVLLALFELVDALRRFGRRVDYVVSLGGGVAFLCAAYKGRSDLFGVIVAAVAYLAFLNSLRPGRKATPGSDVAWTVLAVVWIAGAGAGAVLLLMIPDYGLQLLVATVLIVAVGDIAAYFVGTTFGRHKLAPSISPGKSWEGFVAGIPASVAGGALLGVLTDYTSVPEGLGLGALIALLAPAGDLVESMVKREIGIKDSSRLLPGHGGFLDRLDAILFCVPVAYLYVDGVVF